MPAWSDPAFIFLAPGAYLQRAVEFWRAYNALPDNKTTPGLWWPKYFLFTHAIELALRAYLLADGVPMEDLVKRDTRHSIERLMEMAQTHGLDPTVNDLRLHDEAHRKFWPRYPAEEGTRVFTAPQFESMVQRLIDLTRQKVYGPP